MDPQPQVLILGAEAEALQAALTLAALGRRVLLATRGREFPPPRPKAGPEEERERRILALRAAFHPLIEMRTQARLAGTRPVGAEPGLGAELIREPPWLLPESCTDCGKCLEVCPVDLGDGRLPLHPLARPSVPSIDKRRPAPCREACPLGMNAQGYIALLAQGRTEEAYRLIQETNPLPGVCGRVCDHPCEAACRRGELDAPVAIRDLKRFAVEQARAGREGGAKEHPPLTGPRVAVVGSGPAGLTAAHDLARAGFRPTLIEAEAAPGGLLCQGIAPYRLPLPVLEAEIGAILALGVELRLNRRIDSTAQLEELKKEGFAAVLLCLGAGPDRPLGLPGEDLPGVLGCVDFLGGRWRGEPLEGLGRVAVIGGGNAAVEAARTALRFGAEAVTILYRRTRAEMPADPHEIEQALEEGAEIRELLGPLSFEGEGNRLKSVQVQRMRLGRPDASGRRSPVAVPGAEERIAADTAIVSVGQGLDLSCVLAESLPLDQRGRVAPDRAGLCLPGVYAAGDLVEGPSSVVRAMASGRAAARRLIQELGSGNKPLPPLPEKGRSGPDYEPLPRDAAARERTSCTVRDPEYRILDCAEVVGTYTPAQARQEAARCLQCGVCCECRSCEQACGLGVIDHGREPVRERLSFDRIILADPAEEPEGTEPEGLIRVARFGRTGSFAKSLLAGRAAALEAARGLGRTAPAKPRVPVLPGPMGRTGLLICSCNGTLDREGRLDRLARALGKEGGFVAAEVLVSACHPQEGTRVEEFVQEHDLGGLVLGSCACCSLDFVCESCTDQRMRLKDRLFRRSGLDPGRVALVNLRETCLLPLAGDEKGCLALARRLIGAARVQLAQALPSGAPGPGRSERVAVVGAGPAGLGAALGLAGSGRPVTLVHEKPLKAEEREEALAAGVELVKIRGTVGLRGQRGGFRLEVETAKAPRGIQKNEVRAGTIILAQGGEGALNYRAPGPASGPGPRAAGPRGSLATSIPGVYLASWPQARSIPPGEAGRAAAALVVEGEDRGRGEAYSEEAARTDPEFCRGCGECVRVCPEGAARLVEPEPGRFVSVIDPLFCDGCGRCLAVCPTGAIGLDRAGEVYYREVLDALLG